MSGTTTAAAHNQPTDHQEQLRRRRALDITRQQLKVTDVPLEVARRLRPTVPALVEQITAGIQAEVTAYAGAASGRRHKLIATTVRHATEHFLDILEDRPTPQDHVQAMFRQLGREEAQAEHNLDAMRAAYHVATRDVWEALRTDSTGSGLPNESLGVLGDAVFAYLRQLLVQASIGHATVYGTGQLAAQRSLVTALTSVHQRHGIEQLAQCAQWPIPDLARVAVAESAGNVAFDTSTLPPYILADVKIGRATFVMSDSDDDPASVLSGLGCRRLAYSWLVPVLEIPDACRWVRLALELASRGIIEDTPAIDCSRHRQVIWLHADPILSEQLHRELLAPLLTVGTHQRLNLACTLLVWLRTRGSAPALAKELGVHDQTVRNRLRHLRELFNPRLEDPESTVALLMALEAVVPEWQSADRLRHGSRAHPGSRPVARVAHHHPRPGPATAENLCQGC